MKPAEFPRVILACGCELVVSDGPRGILAVVQRKAEGCGVSIHVAGMPLYDHRAAIRPSTRVHPHVQPDYEDG